MLKMRRLITIVEGADDSNAFQAQATAVPVYVPSHIRTRYMRGKCYAFAVALQKATGMSLWGMFEKGTNDLHHAFVRDRKTGMALDIRGLLPLADVAEGSAVESNADYRPITRKDIDAVGPISRGDMKEASDVARQFFLKWSKE